MNEEAQQATTQDAQLNSAFHVQMKHNQADITCYLESGYSLIYLLEYILHNILCIFSRFLLYNILSQSLTLF